MLRGRNNSGGDYVALNELDAIPEIQSDYGALVGNGSETLYEHPESDDDSGEQSSDQGVGEERFRPRIPQVFSWRAKKKWILKNSRGLLATALPCFLFLILYPSISVSAAAKIRQAQKTRVIPHCQGRCLAEEVCVWKFGCVAGPDSCSRCDRPGTVNTPFWTLEECQEKCPHQYEFLNNRVVCAIMNTKSPAPSPESSSLDTLVPGRTDGDARPTDGNVVYICGIANDDTGGN